MLRVFILYISGGTYSSKSTPNDRFFEKLFVAIVRVQVQVGVCSSDVKQAKLTWARLVARCDVMDERSFCTKFRQIRRRRGGW